MDKQKLGLLGSAGVGAGLGAGLMYLLDPEAGGRRRARVRDKAAHSLKASGRAALRSSRDLGNRTKGLVAGAASRLRREEAPAAKGRWSPSKRLLAGGAGGALALAGLQQLLRHRGELGARCESLGIGELS